MKISVIGGYFPARNFINPNVEQKKAPTSGVTNPQIKELSNLYHPLVFTGASNEYAYLLKSLDSVPCSSCGVDMIPQTKIRSLKGKIANAKSGEECLDIIRPHKNELRPVERCVFELLDAHEYKDLQKTLRVHSEDAVVVLQDVQNEILDRITEDLSLLPESQTQKAFEVLGKTRVYIQNVSEDETKVFKRKTFLEKLEKALDDIPSHRSKAKLMEMAHEFPQSVSSVESFVVKYSRRRNDEIAMRLLDPSGATIEHIKPQSKYKLKKKHKNKAKHQPMNDIHANYKVGKDDLANYLGQCAKCNNTRGNMSHRTWIDRHQPDMQKNIQKYFDKLIEIFRDKTNGLRPDERNALKENIVGSSKSVNILSEGILSPKIPEDFAQE